MSAPVGITPPPANAGYVGWHKRILRICLVIFVFEVGLFLLVFPWLGNWDLNWIPLHWHFLSGVWLNPYFRGGLSGLGLLNLYVAALEAGRQIAAIFARKPE